MMETEVGSGGRQRMNTGIVENDEARIARARTATFFVLLLAIAIPFLHHMLTHAGWQDDRMALYLGARIADGDVPYRDIQTGATPLGYYLIAFVDAIFGVKVYCGRMVLLVVDVVGLAALFLIARNFLSPLWSFAAALLAMPLTLAHYHYNQSPYNWVGLCFQMIGVAFLIANVSRMGRKTILIAGAITFLAFFSSQRAGGFLWLGVMVDMLLRRLFYRNLGTEAISWKGYFARLFWYHLGFMLPAVGYVAYLVGVGTSLGDIYEGTLGWVWFFVKYMIGLPSPLGDWLASAIYLIGAVVLGFFLAILGLLIKGRTFDPRMVLLANFSFCFFLGGLPMFNFAHLVYAIPLAIVLMMVMGNLLLKRLVAGGRFRIVARCVAAMTILVASYAVAHDVRSAQRWDASPGGLFEGVYMTRKESEELIEIRRFVQQNTSDDAAALFLPFEFHLYLWCERPLRHPVGAFMQRSPYPGIVSAINTQMRERPPEIILFNDSENPGYTLGVRFSDFERECVEATAIIRERYERVPVIRDYAAFVRRR